MTDDACRGNVTMQAGEGREGEAPGSGGRMLSLWLCMPTEALPTPSGSRVTWRGQRSTCEDEGEGKASPPTPPPPEETRNNAV